MTRYEFLQYSAAASAMASLATTPAIASAATSTALDRFIAAPDPYYDYKLVSSVDNPQYRLHVLELTSQQWRSASEVDRPLWKHWLTIIEPHEIRTDIGAMIVAGGSNDNPAPTRGETGLARLALSTNSVVCNLNGVPNQPLTFSDEHQPRSEDDLIAYSWRQYLRTGDETWPARLPMTKSVVRAMDAVSDFCRRNRNFPVKRFVVGGTSKRGWTTWTTAAADRRVIGIVPIVIDVLNMRRSVVETYRAYGSWPDAWKPYEAAGIFNWLGTPQLDALLTIEDPFTYRDRLTMPKLIINATGDQFFLPDSSRNYYNALLGEKYLRYIPNADHSLKGSDPQQARSILAFYRSLIDGSTPPNIACKYHPDGTIEVRTQRAAGVKLWRATNPNARDFRLETVGAAFAATDLSPQGANTFVASPVRPSRGWEASFIEVTYKDVAAQPFTLTSGVRITPDTLPYGPPRQAR